MALQDASSRFSDSTTPLVQPPSSAILPVKRSRNNTSRKRKSFVEKFLFTFGTDRGFERLKKATENFFEFVSMVVLRVAGVIALLVAALSLWR
jgi:hypothetical protein